ncbi:hypothetical protein D3C81_914160 [compost metagenome]
MLGEPFGFPVPRNLFGAFAAVEPARNGRSEGQVNAGGVPAIDHFLQHIEVLQLNRRFLRVKLRQDIRFDIHVHAIESFGWSRRDIIVDDLLDFPDGILMIRG